MAAWGLLILIIVIIVLYFVASKVYYEHKIKTGRQQLAGKVILFSIKIVLTSTVLFQLKQQKRVCRASGILEDTISIKYEKL